MSNEEYGLVESILTSVQWGRWQFMLSAPKLCDQDVAIVAHSHRDDWATNFTEKDTVLVPRDVSVPAQYGGLRSVLLVDNGVRIGKLQFACLRPQTVASITQLSLRRLHSFWWLVSVKGKAQTLYVADADVQDIGHIQRFTDAMLGRGRPLEMVMLPSYGRVKGTHGSKEPLDLSSAIERLAFVLKDVYSLTVTALPHPIDADWADYNAVTLPSLADETYNI